MEEKKPDPASSDTSSDSDSLEVVNSDDLEKNTQKDDKPEVKDLEKTNLGKKHKGNILQRITSRINIYLLLFVFLIIVAGIIAYIVSQASSRESARENSVETQELTPDAVNQLNSNEASVGDPKQLLTVESNSIFSGNVLVEGGLEVAGPIKVGGALNLPGITVSGKSAFDEIAVNSLAIAGDTSIQGILTVQQSVTVNGEASFSGPISAPSINVDALSITGDIQFTRHIDAGGPTPGIAQGPAVGSGGTVTISGTDTAGTLTANVGGGPTTGNIATVNFSNEFTGVPHVVVSPVNASAPDIYITSRTTSGFTLRTDSVLPAGSISFDFIVVD